MEMTEDSQRKSRLVEAVDRLAPAWRELALRIHAHPEAALQEHQACAWLSEALEQANFRVVRGVADMPSSFVAALDSCASGPVVAFVAEYDAVPKIGHACGHSLSGAASCLAAHALVEAEAADGVRLRVLGTPGEEAPSVAGKIRMLEAGLLHDVDFAMMAHAGFMHLPSRDMLTRSTVEIEFQGPPPRGHEEPSGGNALEAVLALFNGLPALRRGLGTYERLDAVIAGAGKIVHHRPDYSHAHVQALIRVTRVEHRDDLERRLEDLAQSAADATGATLSWTARQVRYLPMKRNAAMEAAYEANLCFLGEPLGRFPEDEPIGSTDFGNVSQALPGIHAYFRATSRDVKHHTPEYAQACCAEEGLTGMVVAAKAMALTGLDLLRDATLRDAVRRDFQSA